MKLAIFGSTGTVGLQLVQQALEHGHTVTVFVRDPSKLDTSHANMQVMQGDVMDFASVEKAVAGQAAKARFAQRGRVISFTPWKRRASDASFAYQLLELETVGEI